MILEVLAVTTNLEKNDLHKKMNIKSQCIITNQGTMQINDIIIENNNKISYLSNNEKGVGLNRNMGLMRASGDIILFADDDLTYFDDYVETVLNSYRKIKNADLIIFNIKSDVTKRYIIKKIKRVTKFNFMRYGAVRISCKRESIIKNNIFFPLNFGGGTKIGSGEDSIFLKECLDKKLKIYAVPSTILRLNEDRKSTWFMGFNEKYYIDKGKLFKAMFGKWSYLVALRFAFMSRTEIRFINKFIFLLRGIRTY